MKTPTRTRSTNPTDRASRLGQLVIRFGGKDGQFDQNHRSPRSGWMPVEVLLDGHPTDRDVPAAFLIIRERLD
jgi:hypothetical protein